MISLSDSLSEVVREKLHIEGKDNTFLENDLNKITSISISKNDIEELKYFSDLEELELVSFPSIDSDDIAKIAAIVPKIKSLKVKEQSALISLNLSYFKELENVCLIHNDNLESIAGLNKVKRFTFYDNKDFVNVEQIYNVVLNNRDCHIILDIIFYMDIARMLCENDQDKGILDRFTWVESVGLRKYIIHEYTTDEIKSLIQNVTAIVSKYVYVDDGDIERFGILYKWMTSNIEFVNEDDPKNENVETVSNMYKVFNYRKGGRLSFAKAFQLLLSFAGVKSSVVYSLGALESIGYYNGQKVYSLLGTSDYALLRVSIDERYYYCDIAWDSFVSDYKYFDQLRLFLVSKNELKLRHKFVGEGNIEKSYSYHGDDSDDLIIFANDRIKDVDDLFNDIERVSPSILGAELNSSMIKKEISSIKEKMEDLETDSDEYKTLKKELALNEENLEVEQADLLRFKNMRDGIINSYSSDLKYHYLKFNLEDKDILRSKLEKYHEMYLISDYIFDILLECIKAA